MSPRGRLQRTTEPQNHKVDRGRLAQVARHSAEKGLCPQKQVSCRDTVEVHTGALEASCKRGGVVVRPEQSGLYTRMTVHKKLDGLE